MAQTVATRIITGQTTFSGAADQIIPTATLAGIQTKDIQIKALAGNAAVCAVGPAGVTAATGWELSAGQSIFLENYAEGTDLFVIGTAGQKVAYLITVAED